MAARNTITKKELRRIAHHEAGHVVAKFAQNHTVESATIVPGDGYGGRVHIKNKLYGLDLSLTSSFISRMIMEEEVISDLAGYIAEKRFDEKETSIENAKYDLNAATEYVMRLVSSTKQFDAYFDYLWAVAEDMTEMHWDKVKIIAEALLEKKTLKKAALEKLFYGDRLKLPHKKLTVKWTKEENDPLFEIYKAQVGNTQIQILRPHENKNSVEWYLTTNISVDESGMSTSLKDAKEKTVWLAKVFSETFI